jgi:hypothetical protein
VTVIANYLRRRNVDFRAVNQAALRCLPFLVRQWCPNGQRRGAEYVALNPTRPGDTNPGSFSINLQTGRWADFASGDRGGDPISLAAYLHGKSQVEAARDLAEALGVRS